MRGPPQHEVHAELHRLAHFYMVRERPGHTDTSWAALARLCHSCDMASRAGPRGQAALLGLAATRERAR